MKIQQTCKDNYTIIGIENQEQSKVFFIRRIGKGKEKMQITNDIKYIGVNDKRDLLFEGQFTVPDGMAYNSYLIIDEKCAVMDSVDAGFTDEWLGNIERELEGKTPDYLIVQHMEPDHSSSILGFLKKYPGAVVVSSDKAFKMMKAFYGTDCSDNRVVVKEGDSLSLGKHNLKFIAAPMVHWPEVMVTYDEYDKVLFSADGFGKFGALDTVDEWACEARRYYFGIVGKYGAQVQALLKKISGLEVKAICSLHGPVLTENLPYYISLYDTWSSYRAEEEGVALVYTSAYGNTAKAAELLASSLREKGIKVAVSNLGECDMAEAIEDAFRYSHLVLATTTYNGDIFPFMRHFIDALTERGYKQRTVGLIENGSWAPTAAKVMRGMLEGSKDIKYLLNTVKITSSLDEESKEALMRLSEEISKDF